MTFAFSALTRVALEKYCYVVFDIFTVVRVYAMLWVYCLWFCQYGSSNS